MTSSVHRGASYLPWAFTEHGALMAANILRAARAAEMLVFVIRAFVKMREALASNAAVLQRLAEIDRNAASPRFRVVGPLSEAPADPLSTS